MKVVSEKKIYKIQEKQKKILQKREIDGIKISQSCKGDIFNFSD